MWQTGWIIQPHYNNSWTFDDSNSGRPLKTGTNHMNMSQSTPVELPIQSPSPSIQQRQTVLNRELQTWIWKITIYSKTIYANGISTCKHVHTVTTCNSISKPRQLWSPSTLLHHGPVSPHKIPSPASVSPCHKRWSQSCSWKCPDATYGTSLLSAPDPSV